MEKLECEPWVIARYTKIALNRYPYHGCWPKTPEVQATVLVIHWRQLRRKEGSNTQEVLAEGLGIV